MSTFSGLGTAYTGLVAARTGLDVIGQNIANANTPGYTRQRVTLAGVDAPTSSRFGSTASVGQGVVVTAIARLANAQLDERVRATAGIAGYSATRADGLTALEDGLHEPGDNGLSSQLHDFWAAWQDLSNDSEGSAAQAVVLQQAGTITTTISSGYRAVSDQWTQTRSALVAAVSDLNSSAAMLAELNGRIRSAGAASSELLDQRAQLAEGIAALAGGSVREAADGTLSVFISGNALVSGDTVHRLSVVGATDLAGSSDAVRVQWDDHPAASATLDAGSIAGYISLLAPTDATGTGGPIAEAAASYNRIAEALATQVNAVHSTGVKSDGTAGGDFFGFAAGTPSALGIQVVPVDGSGIASGASGAGGADGSIADAISQLGTARDSPDSVWSGIVTGLATTTQTALRQSTLADLAAVNAGDAQKSQSTVDLDEENVNMIAFQHAYQGAARVMTAIDEMLDVLINHTGVVGR